MAPEIVVYVVPFVLDDHTYAIDPVPPVAAVADDIVAGDAPTQMVWSAEIVPAVNAGLTLTVTVAAEEHEVVEFVPVTV